MVPDAGRAGHMAKGSSVFAAEMLAYNLRRHDVER